MDVWLMGGAVMLEGLDQIDWKNLGHHVYRQHEQIPTEIRNLLAPDPEVREAARGFLLGEGQDFGDIYDTTPYIIPFLIDLLAYNSTPDLAAILAHLSGIAEHIFSSNHLSIHMMRLCLATYDTLKTGLPTLIRLLGDGSTEVRLASADLLQYLTDEVEYLIPELMTCFRHEEDEAVCIALLHSLKTLFSSLEWPRYQLHEQYARFFQEIITTHSSHKIRVAAARAAVELVTRYDWKYEQLFPEVPSILEQEFLECSSPLDWVEQGDASFHTENIVRDLARLKPEPLLKLLHHPTLSAEQAHLLARGLLVNAFRSARHAHWEYFPDLDKRDIGMFYVQQHGVAHNIYPRQKALLQAIVATDKVWEQPSNLFSFFYGLPNTRAALHELLNT